MGKGGTMKRLLFLFCILAAIGLIPGCNPPLTSDPPFGFTPAPTPTPTGTPTPTATPTPTPTPTGTPTPTPTPVVYIEAAVNRSDNLGSITVTYAVSVELNGSAYTTATVTLDRPNGPVSLPHSGSGTYQWTSTNAADYQPGGTYTLTVNVGGTDYSDSIVTPGGITIGTSNTSWTSEGNYDFIQITDFAAVFHTAGPDLASPYTYPSLASGSYTVMMSTIELQYGGFSGADASSIFGAQDMKTVEISL